MRPSLLLLAAFLASALTLTSPKVRPSTQPQQWPSPSSGVDENVELALQREIR
jgi:hypothetical protein